MNNWKARKQGFMRSEFAHGFTVSQLYYSFEITEDRDECRFRFCIAS